MVLPNEPFTLRGGCNCGAIRYRIDVPAKTSRPPNFTLGHNPDMSDPKTARIPCVATCHCNDCRLAIGTVPSQVIICPAHMVTVSALPRDPKVEENRAITGRLMEPLQPNTSAEESDTGRPPYLPALDVLRPNLPGSQDTWLRFFHTINCSSDMFSRAFCGRCGTMVSYHFAIKVLVDYVGDPVVMPDGWSDCIDIMLGTIDREQLDQPWMAPERELNFNDGISWAKAVAVKGLPGPKHPTGLFGQFVDEDVMEAIAKQK